MRELRIGVHIFLISDSAMKQKTMTKKRVPNKRNATPRKNSKTKPLTKKTTKTNDASSEENDGMGSEKDLIELRSSSDEGEQKPLNTLMEKNKNGVKGKKRSKEDFAESEEEEKHGNSLYRFPMNRVSRIIKSENPSIKITQEAVFVINKATEKFLQLFCKEAYACASLENKKYTAYNHLSSVVARRTRLKFLSGKFLADEVKAEDALAAISKPEVQFSK